MDKYAEKWSASASALTGSRNPAIDGKLAFLKERTKLPIDFLVTLVGEANTPSDPHGQAAASDYIADVEAGVADLDFRNAVEVGAKGHSNDDFDVQFQVSNSEQQSAFGAPIASHTFAFGFDLLDNEPPPEVLGVAGETLEVFISA